MSEIVERQGESYDSEDESEDYDKVDQNISSTEKKSRAAYNSPGKNSNLSMGDIHASPSKDGTAIPFTEFKIKTSKLETL